MLGKLTRKDYETILRHYEIETKKGDKLSKVKKAAEDILTTKLCRCIKTVNEKKHPAGEKRSIPLCKKSVLHKKGLTDSGFSCKAKTIKLRKVRAKTNGNTKVMTRKIRH